MSYHSPVCDQSYERVGGKQAQANDDSIAKGFEVLFIHAGVDDEKEDGWDLRGSAQGVFDGGVFWEEFGGKVRIGDVFVVRREGVSREAEGAYPEFSPDVDLTGGEEG